MKKAIPKLRIHQNAEVFIWKGGSEWFFMVLPSFSDPQEPWDVVNPRLNEQEEARRQQAVPWWNRRHGQKISLVGRCRKMQGISGGFRWFEGISPGFGHGNIQGFAFLQLRIVFFDSDPQRKSRDFGTAIDLPISRSNGREVSILSNNSGQGDSRWYTCWTYWDRIWSYSGVIWYGLNSPPGYCS